MTDLPHFNIPAFAEASRKLLAAGFEVCSPHQVTLPCGCVGAESCGPQPHDWSDWVKADIIQMLVVADAIATLPGVENSRGAQLEIHVAQKLGWTVQPVGYWLGEVALSKLSPGDLLAARPERLTPPPPPPVRILNAG